MKIIQLTAENIKRLKAVSLTPNEHINRISGPNGSGKTSVLDAIEWALKGTSNVPSHPVRKGSGKGHIIIKTEEFTVYRRFMEGGSRNGTLAIEANDTHNRFQGPQEMLDNLLGSISFDPLEFIRMHPKKQFEVLRSLVKLDIDIDKLDAENKVDYEKRRELKKEVTALETRRDAIKVAEGLPKAKRDEAALVKELQEASDYNANIDRQRREREDHKRETTVLENAITDRASRIAELTAEITRLAEINLEASKDILLREADAATWPPLPEPKNAAELGEAITAARKINAAIDQRNQRDQLQKQIDTTEETVEKLSAALKERDEKKVKAMEEAQFPVKGLGFGSEEVIYEGLPFNQVSNADQIRASVAIGIAFNPKMRVMRVKDGSLLDDKSMAILSEMSVTENFQLFIEVVDTSGKVGVYLEDGEVKAVNDEPEPQFAAPKETAPAKKKAAKKIPATT
jgi:energy-coupling factor transporter ATP-binding protein EcfA2